MSSIKYRPEIDGLRTVAVLPVLLFHLGYEWISGGFLGVDVFFVISGYLITAIILKDFESGRFSFKQFWIRRVRRIFPVLSIMVITTLAVSFFISYRPDLISYGKVGLASIFSLSNIALWKMAGDYWGASAESSPFLHTWSLSVEEQFYFFYPVILILLLKYRIKNIGYIFAASIVAGLALFVYGGLHKPSATFYLFPTRAWELALGCLVAVLHFRGHLVLPKIVRSVLSIAGLLMILGSYIYIDGEEGLNALQGLSVFGAGLIIINNKVDGIVNRFLALPPMVYIGKISYSLYIWHWPVIVLGKNCTYGELAGASQLQIITVTLALSLLSYYLIEKSTREMKHVLRFAVTTLVVSAGLSLFFVFGDYKVTYETDQFDRVEFYGQQYDLSPTQPPFDRELELKRTGVYAPSRDDNAIEGLYERGGIIRDYGNAIPQIVLLGDSHANMWARTLDEICKESDISIAFNTMTGTNPFIKIPLSKNPVSSERFTSEEKFNFNRSLFVKLAEWRPKLVIIGHRWDTSLKSKSQKRDLLEFVGTWGGRVILFEQPPMLSIGNTNTSMFLSYINLAPKKGVRKYIETSNTESVLIGRQIVRDFAQEYIHVDCFKVFDTFAMGNDKAWVLKGKTILYYDDDHLSYQGTLLLKDELTAVIHESIEHNPKDRW